MRILITENCNAKCRNCFNSSYREQKQIDVTTFINLCDYLSQHAISRIKIMGGEPTVHSSFEEIINEAQKRFRSVVIFTNALNDRILNIKPRSSDSIVYNFRFISSRFDKNKFLLEQPGNRRIEVQISSKTNIDNLLKRLSIIKLFSNLKINLTFDCTENIFAFKDNLENKFRKVSNYIKDELGSDYLVDHKIPSCFWSKSIQKQDAICTTGCAGLIDSSLRLRFCNQHEEILCDLLQTNGDFVSYDIITSKLESGYQSKISILENKQCNKCGLFKSECNGGCFAHKSFINIPATIKL